jgi:uncharacterized protein
MLKDKLETELFNAIRNKNEIRKRTIRMAISNIKLTEVDQKGILDDAGIIASLYKEIKIRKETIEDAKKGSRDLLIKEAEEEIAILKEFLPQELNESGLVEIAKIVIQELNASSIKDMGNVMKVMIERIQGQAPNDAISRVVRELLQNK